MPQLPPRHRPIPGNSFIATKPPEPPAKQPQAPPPIAENPHSPRPKITPVPMISLKDDPLNPEEVAALLFGKGDLSVDGR